MRTIQNETLIPARNFQVQSKQLAKGFLQQDKACTFAAELMCIRLVTEEKTQNVVKEPTWKNIKQYIGCTKHYQII